MIVASSSSEQKQRSKDSLSKSITAKVSSMKSHQQVGIRFLSYWDWLVHKRFNFCTALHCIRILQMSWLTCDAMWHPVLSQPVFNSLGLKGCRDETRLYLSDPPTKNVEHSVKSGLVSQFEYLECGNNETLHNSSRWTFYRCCRVRWRQKKSCSLASTTIFLGFFCCLSWISMKNQHVTMCFEVTWTCWPPNQPP